MGSCVICEQLILHPYNEEQRKKASTGVYKTTRKTWNFPLPSCVPKRNPCGVCFEVIMEKANAASASGDRARQFENKIIGAEKTTSILRRGRKCPGNKCFYLHAFPGVVNAMSGHHQGSRCFRNVDTDIDVLQQVMLWDFLDERDFPWQSL
ncbi:hypothetical protein NQ318_003600 [Aromia moschata]|uniref:Uncharacterized protein n=1 Tax=Aromia moschata TaxID=1265417 RepID=A0AAV8YVF3_9CUCU|nr:hypothetical protein NQ318_003600 [Aromia moschata]